MTIGAPSPSTALWRFFIACSLPPLLAQRAPSDPRHACPLYRVKKTQKRDPLKTAPALAAFTDKTLLPKTQKIAIPIIQRSRDQLKNLGMFL